MRKEFLNAIVCFWLAAGCNDAGSPVATASSPPVAPVAPASPLTQQEKSAMMALSPLGPLPVDTTNKYADNPQAAVLGQMLFFDKSYAGALSVGDDGGNGGLGIVGDTGKVACASCHGVGGSPIDDQRSMPNNVSLGTDFGTRNALGLINSSFNKWSNWGGRFDSQWSLSLTVAENPKIMNSTRLQVVHMLWNKYRTEYDATFSTPLDLALDLKAADSNRFPAAGKPKAFASAADGPWELMAAADRDIANTIFVNYGKALQAYIRKLVKGNAPFDRFVAGDNNAISESAVRGLKVFVGKGRCTSCHDGPTFSDDDFHALGVPQTGPHIPATDLGRFQDVPALLASPFNGAGAFSDDPSAPMLRGLAQVDSQRGQFRTKGLRNVQGSGPFMHGGQLTTLADVVSFYAGGGGDVSGTGIVKAPALQPLGLGAQDQDDLIEFLTTLTSEPISATLLSDTSK